MSLAPFAQAMSDLGTEVEGMLANATATYQGGEPFGVLLDRGQTDAFGGGGQVLDAPEITVSFDLAHTPGLAEGSELTINGVVHLVGAGVQGDAAGWVAGLPVLIKRR